MPDPINDLDLAAVGAEGIDAERACLTAGDLYLVTSVLGEEPGRGAPGLVTIEYENGTSVVGSLTDGAERSC